MYLNKTSAYRFVTDKHTILAVWVIMAIVAAILEWDSNNFSIFRGVFWHTTEQKSLFDVYPQEYFDTNHYGPLFSIIIAPFALIPRWAGLVLWNVFITLILYWSIRKSTFDQKQQVFIFWFCTNELYTALALSQFNIVTAALIIMSFCLIEKEQDIWGALCIVIGTFVKLYGIVGIAFFFFSKHKKRFLYSLILWSIATFIIPMLLSSPEHIIEQYKEWYLSIVTKDSCNTFSFYQNISLLGIVRKVTACATYSDIWLIIPGLIIFILPYLRFKQYKNTAFRKMFLASVLMFVVLFSTSSESCSYIIALAGVAIWFIAVPWKRSTLDIAIIIFVFIITSLSPTDIFPTYIKQTIIQPYALKALPVFIVWIKLSYEMCTKDYKGTIKII
ncbi:MAG: DUF2029 domain-containing protein [Bacteroidaceae bacterium]|nr:DUF2029 domain-containing protein [Bacteroidaceae bacterium]